jgi:hypothetical protein
MLSLFVFAQTKRQPRRAANAGKADVQPVSRLSLMSTFPALRSAEESS